MKNQATNKTASLYRMVMPKHVCPWGQRAKYLLERQGYMVEDHHLETHRQTEDFKQAHGVKTTPQTFIGGERIGGYEDLRRFFGLKVRDPDAKSYRPVLAVFAVAAALAVSVSLALLDGVTARTLELFIAFSMALLAMLKLQDVDKFATMFLNYDLLARRWLPYAYIYPFAEATAGVLMAGGCCRGCRSRWRLSLARSGRSRCSTRSMSRSASSNAPALADRARFRSARCRCSKTDDGRDGDLDAVSRALTRLGVNDETAARHHRPRLALASPAFAQHEGHGGMDPNMPGMDHGDHGDAPADQDGGGYGVPSSNGKSNVGDWTEPHWCCMLYDENGNDVGLGRRGLLCRLRRRIGHRAGARDGSRLSPR